MSEHPPIEPGSTANPSGARPGSSPNDALATCSTAALLARVDDGDRAAFDALYGRYLSRVLQVARARIGPTLRRRLDSMDLVQTAFREALEHAGDVKQRSEGMFVRWISAVVQNKIRNKLNYYHAERRDIGREEATGSDPSLDAAAETPSALVEREDRWARLLECMDQLPENEREVLLMKRFENLSWDEIAAELGVPLRTAQDMEVRAKGKIAALMSR